MLKAKVEIQFTLKDKNYDAHSQFRLAFRFDDGLIFSGAISSNHSEYLQGNTYNVNVEFFTIEEEAYSAIQPVLTEGMSLTVLAGAQIIGLAKLLSYVYEE